MPISNTETLSFGEFGNMPCVLVASFCPEKQSSHADPTSSNCHVHQSGRQLIGGMAKTHASAPMVRVSLVLPKKVHSS